MGDSRVYAVASGKGGVGKTTSAVNLGAAFVDAGRSVAVVDLDLGMANFEDFLGLSAAPATLHDVLAGDADLDECIVPAPGGFDAVFGSTDIEDFGKADPTGMGDIVEQLRERYDVVVLDTGGGLSHDTALPLGLADGVLFISTPDDAAVNNTQKTMGLVPRLGGEIDGVIVTRSGGAGALTVEQISERLDARVLGAVPEDSNVPKSALAGTPLVTMEPDSPAAQSYQEIAYGILGEPLPVDWADRDEADAAMVADPVDDEEEPETESEDAAEDSVDEESEEEVDDGAAELPDEDAAELPEEEAAESEADVAAPADESSEETVESEPDEPAAPDDPEPAAEVSEVVGEPSNEGLADVIESVEEEPAESGDEAEEGEVEVDEGDAEEDEAEEPPELDVEEAEPVDDEEQPRSLLSKLTGGLLG